MAPTLLDSRDDVIDRTINVYYQGYIYEIILVATADKYDNVKMGFEHLLETFKFLD